MARKNKAVKVPAAPKPPAATTVVSTKPRSDAEKPIPEPERRRSNPLIMRSRFY